MKNCFLSLGASLIFDYNFRMLVYAILHDERVFYIININTFLI
jgi:hypothetical protein